jgi:peptide/nickel transport system permease protein
LILTFLIRRILYAVSVVVGTTSVLFVLFHMVGGSPATVLAGKNADAQTILRLQQKLGFDKSLADQYGDFLFSALTFDWGASWTSGRPVSALMMESIGSSLSISLPGFLLSYFLSLGLAFLCVHYINRWPDKIIQFSISVVMSFSFVVVIILGQKFLAYDLQLFPVYGWDEDGWGRWYYAALPILIYTVGTFSPKVLMIRALIAEEISKNYILTGRAKGLSLPRLYFVHLLRNITTTLLTLMWAQIPALITGSLLLEAFFGIPGIGYLMLYSIQNSDFPTIKALSLMGSYVYIATVLAGDILNSFLDPRLESVI